jgi:hypothetical protein
MDSDDVESRLLRLEALADARRSQVDVDTVLERVRQSVETLAEKAVNLDVALEERVGQAVRDGVGDRAEPLARHVAELRGLMNRMIRQFERLEGDLAAERNARVDDLALLVDLLCAAWKSLDGRIAAAMPISPRANERELKQAERAVAVDDMLHLLASALRHKTRARGPARRASRFS